MTDENPNAITLHSYQACVQKYCDSTPPIVSENLGYWLNLAVEGLPFDSRILEIGSGHGRDALYLQSLGYKVECSDAAPGFVEHLARLGLQARSLNILTDQIEGSYHLIFAIAVLLHFVPLEAERAIAKMRNALKPGGRIALCVKVGEGEEWTNAKLGLPRYFHYWSPDRLEQTLRRAGFSRFELAKTSLDERPVKWLFALARKD